VPTGCSYFRLFLDEIGQLFTRGIKARPILSADGKPDEQAANWAVIGGSLPEV
jgi:hypothetical protein